MWSLTKLIWMKLRLVFTAVDLKIMHTVRTTVWYSQLTTQTMRIKKCLRRLRMKTRTMMTIITVMTTTITISPNQCQHKLQSILKIKNHNKLGVLLITTIITWWHNQSIITYSISLKAAITNNSNKRLIVVVSVVWTPITMLWDNL